jgi:RimJ/RimL family protein N-acetyltransferase
MTASQQNHLGQPVGLPVPDPRPRPRPDPVTLRGRWVTLVPLQADHADPLLAAFDADADGRGWTYLPYGPFTSRAEGRDWIARCAESRDPLFFTLCTPDATPQGMASYLRIDPANGSIEVGHIHYAPALQRRPAATEAMALLMRHAFEDLGYRRYEWKCDALNAPSRRAAERLGFTYEGTFRQAAIVKGRNRDTAWYAITDQDWPALRSRLDRWLAPENFDAQGQQITRLSQG